MYRGTASALLAARCTPAELTVIQEAVSPSGRQSVMPSISVSIVEFRTSS